MEKTVNRVISYLRNFGKVKFDSPNFDSRDSVNYATIEIVTTEGLAHGLEEEINSHLSRTNGSRAFIRFIDVEELGGGKFKYAAEVVPYEDVPFSEWMEATRDFLHRLPKVVKNYRYKNGCKR